MNDQTEENIIKTAPMLVSRYNSLVALAIGVGMTGYRELKVHDRTTALARITKLESALAAHASGEKAEENRNSKK